MYAFIKNQGKLNDFNVESMMNWHHSWFNAYRGKTVWPDNDKRLENKKTIKGLLTNLSLLHIPMLQWGPQSDFTIYAQFPLIVKTLGLGISHC